MDWGVVRRIWEKWATDNIGSSGGPILGVLLQKIESFFSMSLISCSVVMNWCCGLILRPGFEGSSVDQLWSFWSFSISIHHVSLLHYLVSISREYLVMYVYDSIVWIICYEFQIVYKLWWNWNECFSSWLSHWYLWYLSLWYSYLVIAVSVLLNM